MKNITLLISLLCLFIQVAGQDTTSYNVGFGSYQGEVVNGKPEGFGRIYFYFSDFYQEGLFEQGYSKGPFKIYHLDGELRNEGEYFLDSTIIRINDQREADFRRKFKKLITILIKHEIDSFLLIQEFQGYIFNVKLNQKKLDNVEIDLSILEKTYEEDLKWFDIFTEDYRVDLDEISSEFYQTKYHQITTEMKAQEAYWLLFDSHQRVEIKHGIWRHYKGGQILSEEKFHLGFKLWVNEFPGNN